MKKYFTVVLLLVSIGASSSSILKEITSTRDYVKADLWLNGIQIPVKNEKKVERKPVVLPEELYIPLLKYERELNKSGQA